MTNYTWEFPAFECKTDENGLEKVITNVHWVYRGQDENDISGYIYGNQILESANPDNFTPFTQISEEQVISWMENIVDIEAMKASIVTQIDQIKAPTSVTLAAPWI
jgi:hypothetical protein